MNKNNQTAPETEEQLRPEHDDTLTKQTGEETSKKTKEIGGREGPEPTRYGDWENKGIISDF